jgi:hypothetical protein
MRKQKNRERLLSQLQQKKEENFSMPSRNGNQPFNFPNQVTALTSENVSVSPGTAKIHNANETNLTGNVLNKTS